MATIPIGPTRQSIAGRLNGARVGAIIGAGWAGSALMSWPRGWQIGGAAVVIGVLILLLRRAHDLAVAARTLPDAVFAGHGRRVRNRFLLIVVGEIVAMNVAVALLSRGDLHVYWTAAISLVVGLHFLPMARLFRLRAFLWCGGAITLLAVASALALMTGAHPAIVNPIEALGNAIVLWLTAASGLRDLRGLIPAS